MRDPGSGSSVLGGIVVLLAGGGGVGRGGLAFFPFRVH